MYAVKNNRVVMEGTRNPYDRLWDIPVQKTTITQANINIISKHAGLYTLYNQQNKFSPRHIPATTRPTQNNTNIFKSMEGIFDLQECNFLVDQQLKLDRQQLYDHEFAAMNAIIDENAKTKYSILQPIDNHKLNVVIRKKEPKSNLAAFHHGAVFSPVKSTFLTAIEKNHFTTWPGLTEKLVKKHLIGTQATSLGHQRHDAQGLQSTKLPFTQNPQAIAERIKILKNKAPDNENLITTIKRDIHLDAFPPSDAPNKRTNQVIYNLISLSYT